jgi:hypothetical protein
MSHPVDPSVRRARSAISLGAAVAIFGTVLFGYDAPESQAAGGFLETLFGLGRGAESAYSAYSGYGAYRARISRAPRRFRLAHHARRHDIQARRHVAERRKSGERRLAGSAPGVQKLTLAPAAIEIIGPSRSPFVEVMGAARTPATVSRALPDNCGKSCVVTPVTGLAPRVASVPATDFYADPTLRPGDTIVTPQGMRILRRGSRFPFKATDFVSLDEAGRAPLANRSALHELERAMKTPLGRAPADL